MSRLRLWPFHRTADPCAAGTVLFLDDSDKTLIRRRRGDHSSWVRASAGAVRYSARSRRSAANRRSSAAPARQSGGGGSDGVEGSEGQGPRHVHRRSPVGARTVVVWGSGKNAGFRPGLMRRIPRGDSARRLAWHGADLPGSGTPDGRRWDSDWAADAYVRNHSRR